MWGGSTGGSPGAGGVGQGSRRALSPKVAAGSHVEIEEVDLLQVSLCLHYGHYLATQEGSLR